MTDPAIIGTFACGAVFGMVLCGWPWRSRFSRYRSVHENTRGPSGPPPLRLRRSGDPGAVGPTTPKPGIIPKPQFPPPRKIREDRLP